MVEVFVTPCYNLHRIRLRRISIKKTLKKILIITAVIFASLVVIGLTIFGIFWYQNIHWYDKYQNALDEVGAVEKQFTLPNGNIINYGEVKNDKPALLLIHGQMGIWEDYALVIPELSQN